MCRVSSELIFRHNLYQYSRKEKKKKKTHALLSTGMRVRYYLLIYDAQGVRSKKR